MFKVAIVNPVAVEVLCNECREPLADPDSGSLMWETASPWLRRGTVHICPACGAASRVPARVSRQDL